MKNKQTIKNKLNSRRGFLQDLTKWIGGTAVLAVTSNLLTSNKIKADAASVNSIEPFLGEIMIVGFNFAPEGWALCDGQLLPISQNQALYSLLGTTFGGDGETTFALPDLRGRSALHAGQGPGLSYRNLGERGGEENVILTQNQIPSHNHSLIVNSELGISDNPTGNYLASNSEGIKHYTGAPGSPVPSANSGSIGNSGGRQSHTNMPPYLGIHHIIALVGIFPSEN